MASDQGDHVGARPLYGESLTIRWQLGDRAGVADDLDGMADVAYGQSQPAQFARIGGAAASLLESLGSLQSLAKQEDTERTMAAVREALGEDAFAVAWAEGKAMTWEQAVEYALSDAP